MQLVFYFLGMICTPIFTRSRTKTDIKDDLDPSLTEKGVRGRSIVVLHNGDALRQRRKTGDQSGKADPAEDQGSESSTSERGKSDAIDHAITLPPLNPPTFRRDVTFADE